MSKLFSKKGLLKIFFVGLLCLTCVFFKNTVAFAADSDEIFYFFNNSNASYAKYDFNTDTTPAGYPLSTVQYWNGFPSDWGTFDTAFTAPTGKIYFFKGAYYLRYDIATDRVDQQPRLINDGWPGLLGGSWTKLDAAIMWTKNNMVYFFNGSEYKRYDFYNDTCTGPIPIVGNWDKLDRVNLDAAVVAPNGKAYFFKDGDYLRFDLNTELVDRYWSPIAGNWNLPATYTQKVDSVIWWAEPGKHIVLYAKMFLGTPYLWGGTSPSTGFDCSGFTQYVYNHYHISIPRTTSTQITAGTAVSQSNLKQGDLVFPSSGHVGIYVGNGQIIHSPQTGDVVKISNIWSFYAARRIIN